MAPLATLLGSHTLLFETTAELLRLHCFSAQVYWTWSTSKFREKVLMKKSFDLLRHPASSGGIDGGASP